MLSDLGKKERKRKGVKIHICNMKEVNLSYTLSRKHHTQDKNKLYNSVEFGIMTFWRATG